MTHLFKFTKQSPLQWVLRISSLQHLIPFKSPNFTSLCSKEALLFSTPQISVKDRILPSKSQCINTNIVPSNKGESFTKWAFHGSWKNPNLTSNYHKWVPHNFLRDGGFPLKSVGLRGFCDESIDLSDLKPAPRGAYVISHA